MTFIYSLSISAALYGLMQLTSKKEGWYWNLLHWLLGVLLFVAFFGFNMAYGLIELYFFTP